MQFWTVPWCSLNVCAITSFLLYSLSSNKDSPVGENGEILGSYVGCYFFLQPLGDTEMVVFMYMMGVAAFGFIYTIKEACI